MVSVDAPPADATQSKGTAQRARARARRSQARHVLWLQSTWQALATHHTAVGGGLGVPASEQAQIAALKDEMAELRALVLSLQIKVSPEAEEAAADPTQMSGMEGGREDLAQAVRHNTTTGIQLKVSNQEKSSQAPSRPLATVEELRENYKAQFGEEAAGRSDDDDENMHGAETDLEKTDTEVAGTSGTLEAHIAHLGTQVVLGSLDPQHKPPSGQAQRGQATSPMAHLSMQEVRNELTHMFAKEAPPTHAERRRMDQLMSREEWLEEHQHSHAVEPG